MTNFQDLISCCSKLISSLSISSRFHVEDNKVNLFGPHLFFSRFSVHGRNDGMACGLERLLKNLQLRQAVIRNKYFGHVGLLFPDVY